MKPELRLDAPAKAKRSFAKFNVWKQDPSVKVNGSKIQKELVEGDLEDGPKSSYVELTGPGIEPRLPNKKGDYLVDRSKEPDAFNAMHSFATVQNVIQMLIKSLPDKYGPFKWAWGDDRLKVQPFAGNTPNAYYSRGQRSLLMFYFDSNGKRVFTCASTDILAHETGHALLDGLRPGYLTSSELQSFALHESFGDLIAIFYLLSQLDFCKDIFVETKGNLNRNTFFNRVGEQFGRELIGKSSLRDADNDKTMDDVQPQSHSMSQVFTGAIYNIIEKAFNLEQAPNPLKLHLLGQHVFTLLLSAIMEGPEQNATFADIAEKMIELEPNEGLQEIIRLEFEKRLVLGAPELRVRIAEKFNTPFMKSTCLSEHIEVEEYFEQEEPSLDTAARRKMPKPPEIPRPSAGVRAARKQANALKGDEDFERVLHLVSSTSSAEDADADEDEFDESAKVVAAAAHKRKAGLRSK